MRLDTHFFDFWVWIAVGVLIINFQWAKEVQGFRISDHHSEEVQKILRKRAAMKDPNNQWEEGIIPYSIEPEVSEDIRRLVFSAMHEWESKTCLRFVPDTPVHQYSVRVRSQGSCGCCSAVGKVSKEEPITLTTNACNYYLVVIHELGHAIGFLHEQNRPDRDKYVKILFENIREGAESEFEKYSEDRVDSLGFAYDFQSVMHYGSTTFAKPWRITMESLDNSTSVLPYHEEHLSEIDVAQTKALYKCPKCLFNIYEETATISPSNETSASEEYCQWYIKRYVGEMIAFTLEYVDLPESEGCSTDYLEIRDGYWSKSPLIGRFCGNVSKNEYQTTANSLLITYKRSKISSEYEGFSLSYKAFCGKKLESEEGKLEVSKVFDKFSLISNCTWTIIVPSGYKVALHFYLLKIKEGNCENNYLEVREGEDSGGELIEKFCGRSSSKDILSFNNSVTINMVAKERNLGTDILLSFVKEINECESSNGGCSEICVNTMGSYHCACENGKNLLADEKSCANLYSECGGSFNLTEEVTIASPLYPKFYPVNTKCTWYISNQDVEFEFIHMDIEKSGKKCADKLVIKGSNFSKKTFCGKRIPGPFNATGVQNLKMQFSSDKAIRKTGFAIIVRPLI